jgi:hypothetical protein
VLRARCVLISCVLISQYHHNIATFCCRTRTGHLGTT